MRVGSLCSGIGGIDLGLERAGMTVVWQSEVDTYASAALRKHWPSVPNLGDLKTVDWSSVEPVDLVCGGYPCQPFSLAGARRGEDDPRHLWPAVADALRVLRPRWALFENVPGHLSLGFDTVLSDLASLGFDVEWELLPAAAFGAPHLRYRLWIVAHANGEQHESRSPANGRTAPSVLSTDASAVQRPSIVGCEPDGDPERARAMAYSDKERRGRWAGIFGQGGRRQPEDCGWWGVEPDVGRVADGVPKRVDRLRCLGNAVVPQVAEWIGRRLMDADQLESVPVALISEKPLLEVSDEIVDRVGEVLPLPVAADGDGECVFHLQKYDKPAREVNPQNAQRPEAGTSEAPTSGPSLTDPHPSAGDAGATSVADGPDGGCQ